MLNRICSLFLHSLSKPDLSESLPGVHLGLRSKLTQNPGSTSRSLFDISISIADIFLLICDNKTLLVKRVIIVQSIPR